MSSKCLFCTFCSKCNYQKEDFFSSFTNSFCNSDLCPQGHAFLVLTDAVSTGEKQVLHNIT